MKKKNADKSELIKQLETFEALFNAISDAIVVTDVERKIFKVNKGMETIFGYTIEDLQGKTTSILYESEEEYIRQGKLRFNCSAEEKKRPYEVNYRRKNGEIFPGETIGTVVKNDKGEVIEYLGVVRDVSERKQIQEHIKRLATTDQLTGLANRYQFETRFSEYIKLAKREQKKLALLLLDLDKFKPVNDTHGHQVGDQVLQGAAKHIAKECREIDVVARIGGDEFAVLLMHPETHKDIESVANRIINNVKQALNINGNKIMVETSIGISLYPDDSSNPDELIKMADMSLYAAKKSKPGSFVFYHF